MGSIKDFINKRKKLGHLLTSRFNATYSASGMDDFEFSLISINLPSLRANTSQIYFDGMPVEVFTTFQYDMDFSMTVLCDNAGIVYKKFMQLLKSGKKDLDESGQPSSGYAGNFNFQNIIDTGTTITITALEDYDTEGKFRAAARGSTPMTAILYGVRIKAIGNLDFSNSSNEVANFSVNASVIDFEINPKDNAPKQEAAPAPPPEPAPTEQPPQESEETPPMDDGFKMDNGVPTATDENGEEVYGTAALQGHSITADRMSNGDDGYSDGGESDGYGGDYGNDPSGYTDDDNAESWRTATLVEIQPEGQENGEEEGKTTELPSNSDNSPSDNPESEEDSTKLVESENGNE